MATKYTKEQEIEIIRLYVDEKKNQKEIAEIFGTYNTTIRRILLRNGVEIIGNSERQRRINLSDIQPKEGTDAFDYFIGVLITDGCNTKGAIIMDFGEKDKEILEYWNEFLGNKLNITTSIHNKYNIPQYRLSFRSKPVVEYLESFGIVERKTYTAKLKYINWSILRGIIDGDGSIFNETNSERLRLTITSGSEEFLLQIKEFLNNFQITSTIRKTATEKESGGYYVLSVYKQKDIYFIYNNMYKNASYFLKRKYEKFGSLSKKFVQESSVNSGKEGCASNPEPSLIEEGAETRHGEPK